MKHIKEWLWLPAIVFILLALFYGIQHPEQVGQEHYGIYSLFPAVVTLFLCFYTKNVILALFTGIVVGGLVTAEYNILNSFLFPSLGSEKFAKILLVYLWALGGLIGIWNRNGGARYFAEWIGKHFVHNRKTAKLFAWFMGLVFHQGGTISTVLTGTTVKPITDREKVSHEELSYIVDSTASPIATLIPLNAWPAYIGGLVVLGSIQQYIPNEEAGMMYFLKAIPYNFYAMFAVLFTFLISIEKLPWMGKQMREAINRVTSTGEMDRPGAKPMLSKEIETTNIPDYYKPSLIDFFVPIGTLVGVAIVPWILIGKLMIFEAFGLSVIAVILVTLFRGMKLDDVFEGLVDGIKGVTVGAIILGLAITLGNVSERLGTSQYIIEISRDFILLVPYTLPPMLLFICMFISFSIGSSWGTYAVVYPIAIPLAISISADPFYITLNFAAIMGGAVFGDQCSPISDTTILSAMVSGADLMDHVSTQLPLALLAASLAAVLYLIISYSIF
ncbi:MAG: sodium:proton antiporter [Calditrichia bacterium]|nr:sodium:proton antiporter [Calditrichia bacterium]